LCFCVIQKRDTRDKARAKLFTDKDEELKAMIALQKEGKRMFRTIYNSDEGGIENEVEQAKERVQTKNEMSMHQRFCLLHLQTDSCHTPQFHTPQSV